MVTRLLWVLPHATPYNIYLLNEIAERLSVSIEALYRWPRMASHPWNSLPSRRFAWRVVAEPGGRDGELERRCGEDDGTLPIFAGWRDATIRPALLIRRRRRFPYVFWTDTPKVSRVPLRALLNAVYVGFAKSAVTTLATGAPAVERYLAMGVPVSKVDNFPFVVDPQHFASAVPQRASRSGDLDARFVTTARLIDRLKGQSVALDALARLRRLVPDRRTELVLAGMGADEAWLRARASILGLADIVRFTGWIEYSAMPQLLGSADALVLPSRWDPFPVAVIEAMAAGLPVLGSDACGSVRERVVHGTNGFVHRAGDAATLADHMRVLVTSRETRGDMGQAALETSNVWGIDHCVRVLQNVLERLSHTGPSAACTAPFQGV